MVPNNPVYERAYAQDNPDGTPAPTTNWFNPQWAEFFDRLKAAGVGTMPGIAGGVGQTMPAMHSIGDTASPTYNSAIDPLSTNYDPKTINQSLEGLKLATKAKS